MLPHRRTRNETVEEKHTCERLTVKHSKELSPEDWAQFIQLPKFSKAWKKLDLDEADMKALQMGIMASPQSGAVIPGTGGLRKLRFSSN